VKLPKGRIDYHTKKLALRGTRPSPHFAQNGPIVPKIPWTLSSLDMSTYTEFGPDRLPFARLIPERLIFRPKAFSLQQDIKDCASLNFWDTVYIVIYKVRRYETFVVSVLVYGSECWCLKKEDEWRILSVETAWLRRLMCNMKRQDKKGYCTKYSTARRITCSEDNEATTHMVRACDKNWRRTITAERVTLSSRRRKKSGSTTKITDDVHQRRRCGAR